MQLVEAPDMYTGELPFGVSPASFFPSSVSHLIRPFEPSLQRFFFPEVLMRPFFDAQIGTQGTEFADKFLRGLNISYQVSPENLGGIPSRGPALAVVNHPFGFLEGLILLSVLEKLRVDYKILANSLLSTVTQLRDRFIFINPFELGAVPENTKGLRACLECLGSGGLLVMFPAGEVSHLNWGEQFVADPKWNETAARLARKSGCPTVPIFFDGSNSLPFQMIGTLHPRLRTLNLPRELMKKSSQTIQLKLGSPVPAAVLRRFSDAAAATDYLRARVYLLSSRINPGSKDEYRSGLFRGRSRPKANVIEEAHSNESMLQEIADLPRDRLLASNDEFYVYIASAEEIPSTLREIGRCREVAFRQIGEGTQNATDLDRFDPHYQHLFLWSRRDQQLAGGYRLIATPDALPKLGIAGLYTSTLFQYAPDFFVRLGPAFELGRSFIRAKYQKHYAPLLLLWRGIARCVERRPECAVLFGAVSISSDYNPLSRVLIMNFMTGHMASELSTLVKPRHAFRPPALLPKHIKSLSSLLSSIEEVSSSVSDLERDGKGVPVLIRHYLKIGGQVLGFNVDKSFSNALDGLILADLRSASPAILERCMGRQGAASFQAWHRNRISSDS